MAVHQKEIKKMCGKCTRPGSTLARCRPVVRTTDLDQKSTQKSKSKVVFGVSWVPLQCSWALLGWVGGAGDAHRVLRESEPANLRLRKVD